MCSLLSCRWGLVAAQLLVFFSVAVQCKNYSYPDLNSNFSLGTSGDTKKVYLWTSSYEDGVQYEELNADKLNTIVNSHFDGSKPTYVIVHGFLSWGIVDWIVKAKTLLMQLGACNVLSVDWYAGNTALDYYTVTYRVPLVGADTALLLKMLHRYKGLDIANVHVIGHSLGAHVAGFTGKALKDVTLARITGLDPAGVSYRDTDASVRLDKSDASYVDIIHTNGCRSANVWLDCFGIDNSIGHTDFRPNGGKYQPACKKLTNKTESLIDTKNHSHALLYGAVGCDHQKAHDYFVESLKFSTLSSRFVSRTCRTYSMWSNGSCGGYPQYMGFNANPYGSGEYFLQTGSVPPYGLVDYHCPSGLSYLLKHWILISAIVLAAVCGTGGFVVPVTVFAARAGYRRYRVLQETSDTNEQSAGESNGGEDNLGACCGDDVEQSSIVVIDNVEVTENAVNCNDPGNG